VADRYRSPIGRSTARTAHSRADPLYDEVAEWLSSTNNMETCMREAMARVTAGDETTSAVTMPTQLQHRIRGALNTAGFESTGRKFSADDYKGMTTFALVQREVE
jgi:hypothetical protein